VVEFLLGRYGASTDPAGIEEGLQIVEKQLQGQTPCAPEKRSCLTPAPVIKAASRSSTSCGHGEISWLKPGPWLLTVINGY